MSAENVSKNLQAARRDSILAGLSCARCGFQGLKSSFISGWNDIIDHVYFIIRTSDMIFWMTHELIAEACRTKAVCRSAPYFRTVTVDS